MPALFFSWYRWFYTADKTVTTGIMKRNSTVCKSWDNNFIVVHSRKTITKSCKLTCTIKEFIRCSLPYTDGEGRCAKTKVSNGFHHHIR